MMFLMGWAFPEQMSDLYNIIVVYQSMYIKLNQSEIVVQSLPNNITFKLL